MCEHKTLINKNTTSTTQKNNKSQVTGTGTSTDRIVIKCHSLLWTTENNSLKEEQLQAFQQQSSCLIKSRTAVKLPKMVE